MRGLSMVPVILGPPHWPGGDLPHARRALRRPAGLPVGAGVRRGGGRRRRHAADGVRRRRSSRRAGRAAAARRAVVVLPVPPRDPGASPTPASGAWRRTWSASAARTSRSRPADHTFARHVEWMRELVLDHLDLRDVTLVGQDWGGLLGLRLVAEHPDRFARVVAANTGLPDRRLRHAGALVDVPQRRREGRGARHRPLRRGRLRARDLPTRSARPTTRRSRPRSSKAGARAMPTLVPTRPDDPAAPRQPGRLGGARRVGQAVPGRLQRLRPDHRRHGDRSSSSTSPARTASTTRPSPAPATSSRRTPARSWAGSSPLHVLPARGSR